MGGFDVTISELPAAAAEVRQIESELKSGQSQLTTTMTSLLSGGWSGAAATAFSAAWSQWLDGANDTLDGLARTGQLLGATEQAYSEHDQLNASTISRLNGGL